MASSPITQGSRMMHPEPAGTYWPPLPPPASPKKSRTLWVVVGGLVGVLVLGVTIGIALTADGGQAEPKPVAAARSEQQSAKPKPGNVEFATAVQLVGALNKTGPECAGWTAVPEPIGAQERGSCHIGGEEVTTAIYTTSAAAGAEPQKKAELLAGVADVHMVVGPNWTLGCDSAELCEKITAGFGGKFVTISSESAATPKPAPTTTKPAKVSYAKLTDRGWKKIAKNPDAYVGKGYVVYGVVTQFDAATGTDAFRADVAARNLAEPFDYDTNTILSGDAELFDDLVEDDEFRAQVTVVGAFEYETQIGGETTVPQLEVTSVKVI
jgi:hypothetical protein